MNAAHVRALLSIALLLCCGFAAAADYRFDTEHSQILASANHNGFSAPVGRLAIAAGWLRFDADDWSRAATVLDIDLASIDFGNADWNRALCTRRWLDCDGSRYAHFVSTGVSRHNANEGVLHGTLTLRGVSQPLDLAFRVNRVGTTVFGLHRVAGFSASTTLDRRAFGLRANTGSVGTTVTLRLEIEAIRDHNAESDYRRSHLHADTATP
ncbi:MAG TPA: YceI family protein [Rhodanobacteraceae bacterium]|nr:YceI family protein [Rhodanobacteraceae bacterium]